MIYVILKPHSHCLANIATHIPIYRSVVQQQSADHASINANARADCLADCQ